MSVEQARSQVASLLASQSRANLHYNFPSEFEYYLCALELTDSNNKQIDMLIFPVMPNSISHVNTNITSVTKTASGVVSLSNNTFVPININIQGNFGRKFRFLTGRTDHNGLVTNDFVVGFQAIRASFKKNKDRVQEFNKNIKTGYGVIKILESIFERSVSLDGQGNPYKLFFYNLALNSNYLVEGMNLTLSQSVEMNMIWNYSLSMTAIAPASEVTTTADNNSNVSNLLKMDNLRKRNNAILDFTASQAEILKNQLLNANRGGLKDLARDINSDITTPNRDFDVSIGALNRLNSNVNNFLGL